MAHVKTVSLLVIGMFSTGAFASGIGEIARVEFRRQAMDANTVTLKGRLSCKMGSVEAGSCIPALQVDEGQPSLVLRGSRDRAISLLRAGVDQAEIKGRVVNETIEVDEVKQF
jgi:hypothetical protein